ncbi:Mechanosensitive ion channel [Desulfonatronum thiosulfatophilum]|uniref:Mechanosensitive ion channel n=1 Tax=Desulfonatronum thiosulfatophilum TaxID=617002 RepID=A0A1G6A8H1_9BACT|nr:mechanosensitive ion channel domain-containing protein [Desulfonatronum thiosulfatophilum]SDB04727.1 Mechanosensitive ion channel [Desulfonatronum thiosulfatophilum]
MLDLNAVLNDFWEVDWWGLGVAVTTILVALSIGLFLHGVLFHMLHRLFPEASDKLLALVPKHLTAPSRLLFPLLVLMVIAPNLVMPEEMLETFRHVLSILFILAIAWSLIRFTSLLQEAALRGFQINTKNNLAARKMHTQIGILRRILIFIISVIAISSMLMTLDNVRQIGVSLLASAGVIGIIAGFAAQRSISTLFAGVQVALTQPIRLDDVVIVEGEWGRIEEITLTYVVVRIWDQRRLIVPITFFMEQPFQNWTRVTSEILGTVFLYTDYTVPVDVLRAELHRILKESPNWDGRVWGLQVTDATDRTLELRALMSAEDAGAAWDLRCHVREKLLEYVQREHPQALPRVRAEMDKGLHDKPELSA